VRNKYPIGPGHVLVCILEALRCIITTCLKGRVNTLLPCISCSSSYVYRTTCTLHNVCGCSLLDSGTLMGPILSILSIIYKKMELVV